MGATREAVFSALLTKVAASAGFVTSGRRIELVPGAPTPQVATPVAQPAIFLFEDNETTKQSNYGPTVIRTWRVQLWVWCQIPAGPTLGVPDTTIAGATILNPLIDAIEVALAGGPMGPETLGGLVRRVWIEGETVKVPGDLNPDGQCVAMIPVSIMVP